ncbi:MAG TPA: ion channel [Chloroflexota bacterium]
MTSQALHRSIRDVSPRDRRRVLVATVARLIASTAILLAVYALLPIEGITTPDTVGRLVIVLIALPLVFAWQIHAIKSAKYPDLRATEAVIGAVTIFVILFALLYLGLGLSDPANFSQSLDRISAIYFTVTVLSTVGFGDISAQSDVSRLLVTIQMLLDLALIAIVVHVFFGVARASEGE